MAERGTDSMKKKKWITGTGIRYLVIFVVSLAFLLPFIWMILCSFKTERELFTTPVVFWPEKLRFENYKDAVTQIPFLRFSINTIYICILSILGVLLSGSMVAFSVSKLKWRGSGIVFTLVIASMMIPYQVTMIPIYMAWNRLGLVDTYVPLILPCFFAPSLYVFLLRQFFLTIPDSLMDASKIDGATDFRIWWDIMIPLSKGIMATVGIFVFVYTWSDFMGPLLYINSMEKRTLSLGMTMFLSEHEVKWGALMAASAIFNFIIIIPYLLCQKQLVNSVKLSGFK